MGIGEMFEFEKTGRFDSGPKPTSWRSVAVWPDTIEVGHTGKNESDDIHSSEEQARAVCRLLKRHGFGGEGKVFPLTVRVEPVWS